MQSFIQYAQFDEFWERLEPQTPYGKDMKQERPIYSDLADLEAIWQGCEQAAQLLRGKSGQRPTSPSLPASNLGLNRINYHLKRLPRFRTEPLSLYDEVDIFEIKKFLFNYHQLLKLLPEETRTFFKLSYTSQELEDLLSHGDQYAETFYVADEYSPELRHLRQELRALDTEIEELKAEQLNLIEKRCHWNICGDFILVKRAEADKVRSEQEQLVESQLSLEPYDSDYYMVRLRPQAALIAALNHRQELLSGERQAEARILEQISQAINDELPRVLEYRDRVRFLDMSLARAKLAQAYDMVVPTINEQPDMPIAISEGRFIICQESCQRLGANYIPLDLELTRHHNIIFGSNMGGKTITLKTLAFLQLCVQCGLYVPARSFRTTLFRHFHYIGEGRCDTPQQGLSGFGFEMSQFCQAHADFAEPTLVLFDEFARTTNSREAEALISAILEDLIKQRAVWTLFSSHFHGIARLPQVGFFKMRGLKRDLLQGENDELTQLQRLQHINELIDYRVQPDPEHLESSDAIAIAGLLGVPEAIVSRAQSYIGG